MYVNACAHTYTGTRMHAHTTAHMHVPLHTCHTHTYARAHTSDLLGLDFELVKRAPQLLLVKLSVAICV